VAVSRDPDVLRVVARRCSSQISVATIFVLAWAGGAGAQSASPAHGKVELYSKEGALDSGRLATLGVLFDLLPGWHIYWVNPGDAGEPPRLQWDLPTGFRAGDVRWPTPLRLGTGPLVDYGYEGRVLLPVPLQAPADYRPGAPVMLSADVRYVVCREVCIPARTRVALSLPADSNQTLDPGATRELFREAEARMPKATPPGWKVLASQDSDQIVLTVQTGSPEAKVEFFPLERDQIDNAAAQVAVPTGRDGLRLTLKKSVSLDGPVSVLKGLLVFGPDRVYEIQAPVSAQR
jgi:thiol:disulfide interchange protein DsbD